MLYVICIIYYMLYILYMIPLSVNANGVFTLIYTFFYQYIFKSILKKNENGLNIKDERHMKWQKSTIR